MTHLSQREAEQFYAVHKARPFFNDLVKYADTHNVDTRTAAYMLAIDRVAYDTRMRGIYA